jgi:Ni/Fe-hydrogenase subunit HybB-like protein
MKWKFGFWRVVLAVILVSGVAATVVRFTKGLGGATHLSDAFPWGLWVGFDVLCGVGLAAGGFTVTAAVHIFHIDRFKPIVRPAVLTAFLGYLLVIVGLAFDLGKPWNIWHPIVMWNHHSVMFEVAWCVTLYTAVLALEFSPMLFERLRWKRAVRTIRLFTIPLVVAGVLLSTLHQSSLGSLFLIVPSKLHPLWYTPWLPVLFFVSSVVVGCAMVMFESFMSRRAFGRELEFPILVDLGRVALVGLIVYAELRFLDLYSRGALVHLMEPTETTFLFLLEILLLVALPVTLLAIPKVRMQPRGLFVACTSTVLGFILNRLNVSITGMQGAGSYFPHWMEIAVSLSIVGVGFAIFGLAARYLPIFNESGEASKEAVLGRVA